MTGHGHHGHGGLGAFALVAAIAFVFGINTARYVVGSVLVAGLCVFVWIAFLVVTGAI